MPRFASRGFTNRGFANRTAAVLSVVACLAYAGAALAQAFPAKPIGIVVGFTPGGGTDITARVLAQRLSTDLGQSVVVSNKSGAAGAIAAGEVARAPADGHTLLMIASATIAALALNANVNFSLEKDLTAVAQVTNAPMVMLLHPGVPASDVKQVIAYARANPGALSFGSTGVGSGSHLASGMIGAREMAGTLRILGEYPGVPLCFVHVALPIGHVACNTLPSRDREIALALALTGIELEIEVLAALDRGAAMPRCRVFSVLRTYLRSAGSHMRNCHRPSRR